MKPESAAPCPSTNEVWHLNSSWDIQSKLQPVEQAALEDLSRRFAASRNSSWPPAIREDLSRLTVPLRETLKWMNAAQTPANSAVHDIVLEMHRLGKTYWSWTQDEWLEVMCESERAFRIKYRSCGNCRQYILALAWLLCRFNKLEAVGCFFQYRLAIKVYGRSVTDVAVNKLQDGMLRLGFTAYGNTIRNALCMAMLCQREPDLEKLELETLKRVVISGPKYMRRSAASLSRILMSMGILSSSIDHRITERRRPFGEYQAISTVPSEWLRWCERWRDTSVRAASSILSQWYGILKCGRWLADTHPEIHSPADWTRDLALEYGTAVCKMKIGQWSEPGFKYRDKQGLLLKPAAREKILQDIRVFFRDLQEWGLIPVRFDPGRVFRLPTTVRASIGPAPRTVADAVWSKLVWAGLNLHEQNLRHGKQPAYRYPFAMVKAMGILWLFGGLRRDEILRVRTGCVHWHADEQQQGSHICLLDVPVNKTNTAFTKPVDPVVGESIASWEKERRMQPPQIDTKTNEVVNYLFMHRGHRVHSSYINKSLIPLLCRAAGVPLEDAKGPITSHRARATIASQLFNAKEPLGLIELQRWLGHASPGTTQYYVDVTPTKLAGSLAKAGYFERNRRMVSVLIDQDAIKNGTAATGEPWRYYDLGHGFCSYDFFEQCPHRMACAKCSFYLPKDSSKMQIAEANQHLQKMLQEIPLTDAERAAVEDGINAMHNLTEQLKNIPTPDNKICG